MMNIIASGVIPLLAPQLHFILIVNAIDLSPILMIILTMRDLSPNPHFFSVVFIACVAAILALALLLPPNLGP